MRYTTAAAFRQALDDRLKAEAANTGLALQRLRKRVAFELFLRRLVAVAPERWVLKGALALELRLKATTRATKDIDLGRRDDDETAAIEDITAAQQLALDDFFTHAATRTDELSGTDEFTALRFHVTAQLAGRTFEQFTLDIGFTKSTAWTPDTIETSDLLSFAGIEPVRASSLAPPRAPRGEDARLHKHLRPVVETKHTAEGPRRHPPDRRVRAHPGRRTQAGARGHLRRTRTSAAAVLDDFACLRSSLVGLAPGSRAAADPRGG